MTPEQYQLLRAARPSGKDERDPLVIAARSAAEGRLDVLQQLAEDKKLDTALCAALSGVMPPPGLESSLITAIRAARGTAEPPASLKDNIVTAIRFPASPTPTSPTRRQWLGWASAAAAAIAAGSTYWWRSIAFSMPHLVKELSEISEKGVQLSLMSMDPAAIDGWMSFYQAPRPSVFPPKLAALPRKGCHLYTINDHPVSLECFLLPGMKEIHLFCTPAADLRGSPEEGAAPVVEKHAEHTLASWTNAGQTVLLFSNEPVEVISGLLV